MMAKFKKGDRVRCVKTDRYKEKNFSVGDIGVVDETYLHAALFNLERGYIMSDSRWELDTQPIPDTVTIGGVEYVRKPEPEHVWAWGQWARVNHCCRDHFNGQTCFVLGGADECGFIPVSLRGKDGKKETDGLVSACLTYLGTATIPE